MSAILSIVLATAGLTAGLLAVAAPAHAAGTLLLEVVAPNNILAGQPATVTLTATNDTTDDYFNASYKYVLAQGVAYVDGSSSGPAGSATSDPRVIVVTDTSPPGTHQVLIWDNLIDIPQGLSGSVSFRLTSSLPVGSSFGGSANVYANTDPRVVAKFDAVGTADSTSFDGSATAPSGPGTVTRIEAIKVTKTEPSPEHELLRGVHNQQQTYTITTENTTQGSTDSVIIVDYLPAGLEFLGCTGDTDNTAGQAPEYVGSGPLFTTAGGPDCRRPFSVETINDRPDFLGQVFTKVIWNLGTLAPGQIVAISYGSGIPLLHNAMFATGTAISGVQGSNLDNNTGASTRQLGTGAGLTNTVEGTGSYQGPVAAEADRATASTSSLTVTAMDLSVVKSVADPNVQTGGTASFSLLVRAGEYTSDAAMTIVDTIPDGLCPLVPTPPGIVNNTGAALPPACLAGGVVTNATVDSTVANDDGSFTLTLTPSPSSIAPNGTITIGYDSFQSTSYRGAGQTGPVVAGDSFVNAVSINGTTTDTTGTQLPANATVTDDSAATLTSSAPSISKMVLPRPTPSGTPIDCAAATGYTSIQKPTYLLGDTICFQLTVNFATSTETRNARITDFVPVGTTYLGWAAAPGNTVAVTPVPGTQSASPAGDRPAAWNLGDTAGGTDRFVAKAAVLTMYVSATVSSASSTSAVDITANLMKYRQASTKNTVLALRDSADFGIAPSPVVTLAKGVSSVTSGSDTVNYSPAATNPQVREGDVVTFSVIAANTGTSAAGNAVEVDNLRVWDALPTGYDCVTWSVVVPGGICRDPGDTGYPINSSAPAGRSVIVWTITDGIAPGTAHAPLAYSVVIPSPVSVSTSFSNSASVVSFTTPNTSGGDTPFYPKGSLDPAHDTDGNTAPANAEASVHLPDAEAAKSGTTGIASTNNSAASQAVPGETVDYTYQVTIPARSSVYNAVLRDSLPAGLRLPGAPSFVATMDGAILPAGVVLDATDGSLRFGSAYTNGSSTAQVFAVTAAGLIVDAGLTPGSAASITTIVNTADFSSTAAADMSSSPLSQKATYSITVINPQPTLVKTVDRPTAAGGETVVFTLSAANTSGAPDAFDPVVVDCLPTGLDFVSSVPSPTSTGTCADGVELTWTLPTPLPFIADPSSTITVTATVDPASAGLARYINKASLTSSSLDNASNDPAVESVQNASATAAVVVQGATTVKAVTPIDPTVGDSIEYNITVTVPPNESFYSASIIDTLPVGIAFDAGSDVVTCAPTAACPGIASSRLTDGSVTASGQKIGWALGDLAPASVTRTYVATFSGTVIVATPSNVAGVVRTNTAYLAWYSTAFGTPPTTADSSFEQIGDPGSADLTITEPLLSISKGVSDSAPEPGDSFTYTVQVANSGAASRSTAFSPAVTDVVPTGVIVDATSLASNGTLSGAGPNGGGTITWSPIAPIAPGAIVTLTYSATLAPSRTLGAVSLVNTADVPTYDSRPSGGRNYDNVAAATASVAPAFPRITLAKPQPDPSTAYRGESFNWTIRATNAGGAAAQSVVMVDTLPPNWTFDPNSAFVAIGGVSVGQIDPTVAGTTLTWSFGRLPVGQSISIAYSSTPGPDAVTGSSNPHVNTITADATDATGATSNAAGAYSTETRTATARIDRADVTVAKDAGDPLVAGTTVPRAWAITVTNSGPDQAVGTSGVPFIVSDAPVTLPPGVTIVAASGNGWSCSVPTSVGAFSCTRTGVLNSNASFEPIYVSVSVAADVPNGTSATNSVNATALTFDPTNSDSKSTISVVTNADLGVTKTVDGTPLAGRSVSWTIGVSNIGPSVSVGPITVTDVLPAELSNVSAAGTGWSCPVSSPLVCTRTGPLAVGPAPSIVVTGTLASSFTGSIENSATVDGPNDSNGANDTATTSDPVNTTTALTLAKSLIGPVTPPADPAVVPGQNARYRFDVTNVGAADARDVVVTDALPTGFAYVASSATGGWTCTGTTTISCSYGGTLPAASRSTMEITVTTPSTITGPVDNTGVLTSANAPTTSGSALDPSTPRANFSITKTHPSGPVIAGTPVVYSLSATNLGPSDSPGPIVVTDTMPSGMTATAASVTGAGWACGVSGQVISCTRAAALGAGATAPVILATTTIASDSGPSTLVNAATVAGPLPTTDSSRASTTDDTVVSDDADVSIAKTTASGFVRAGDNITYSLTVENAGPSTADSLTVSDLLPAGMTALSITGSGWSCSLSSLTCVLPTLPPGDSVITVVASVASSAPDGSVLTNDSTVQWVENGVPQFDSSAVDVIVTTGADLALAKVAVRPSVAAGDTAAFTLTVANLGPSDAGGPVTIVDTLPVGFSYLSASAEWSCFPTGQIVNCTLGGSGGLAAGATASVLTLITQVDAELGAVSLTNSATVESATSDPDSLNNTGTAAVNVDQAADISIVKSHRVSGVIGEPIEFSLAVFSAGPSVATGVTVVDTLPRGLTYLDVDNSDPGWTCVAAPTDAGGATTVTCTLATSLPPGTFAPALLMRVMVEIAAYPSVDNVADVSSAIRDPDPVDNTSRDTIAVDALVDLGVDKTHFGQLVSGAPARYEIAVSNSGPTEDPGGFVIVDDLPSSLKYIKSTGVDVSCVAVDQKVTCTFSGPLRVGETRSVVLTVMVLSTASGAITNTASVASLFVNRATHALQSTDIASVSRTTLPNTGGTVGISLLLPTVILLLVGIVLVVIGYRRPARYFSSRGRSSSASAADTS